MKPAAAPLRGFTLLELLLAIALGLLLGLLAYGGLHLGLASWRGLDRQLQQAERTHLGQQLLRRLLASPQAECRIEVHGQSWLAFQGRSDSLLFCARLPGQADDAQLYWLQLVQERPLSGAADRWRLLLRYQPWRSGAETDWQLLEEQLAMQGAGEVLLDGLARPLRFAYLEPRHDGEPRWQEEWLERSELPLLLRVRSEAAADGRPPQVVELRVGLEAGRHAVRPAR